MDYISAITTIGDAWNVLILPVMRVGGIILVTYFILGKDTFNYIKDRCLSILRLIQEKLNYKKRLGKAEPVVSVFFFIFGIYALSTLYSILESFFRIDISGSPTATLGVDTILNVWQYYPHIDNVNKLQQVVLYQYVGENTNTFAITSSRGISILPEILLTSLLLFTIIMLIISIIFTLIRITKKGKLRRIKKVLRAFCISIFFIVLLIANCFNMVNTSYSDAEIWRRTEANLLVSGPPPTSNILTEKAEEAASIIRYHNYYFDVYFAFGPLFGLLRCDENGVIFHFDNKL